MSVLPEIRCKDRYSALYEDDAIWRPAVRAIAARHGFEGGSERLILGTHVVYGMGEAILKIYCPLWAESFHAERIALEGLDGLPAPRVLALGKIEGWPYLVQSRAAGVPAQSVWRKLSLSVRLGLGRINAVLGAIIPRRQGIRLVHTNRNPGCSMPH